MATVEERVIDIVAEQLGADKGKIATETHFVNDLGADSLDTVDVGRSTNFTVEYKSLNSPPLTGRVFVFIDN